MILTVDREDFAKDAEFEEASSIKPLLYKGFELPPSPLMAMPQAIADISLYGDQWTRTMTTVYLKNGRIIYKKLHNGRYEAKLQIPLATGTHPTCPKCKSALKTHGEPIRAFVQFGGQVVNRPTGERRIVLKCSNPDCDFQRDTGETV